MKSNRRNRSSQNTNTNVNVEDKAMKSNRRNRSSQNTNTNVNVEDKAMKSNRRNRSSQNTNTNATEDAKKQAVLAALAALGIDGNVLFGNTTDKPADTEDPKKAADKPAADKPAAKADRTYEIPSIGADFTKSGIYARPKSDDAARYMASAKDLCADALDNLRAPIAADVRRIAAAAEKNGGDTLKDDLLRLADQWEIPAQSMRVVMQLCAPVVCCCNSETDYIARRAYCMSRANSLMGSACNTLMYAKAADKDNALPFKRVAHNLTTLGLDFCECNAVSDCDFCDDEDDFDELVELCDMWLAKCKRIAPAPAPAKTRGKKAADKPADKPADTEDPKKAAALAALAALGIDPKTLFK